MSGEHSSASGNLVRKPAPKSHRHRVVLVPCGGTIDSIGASSLDLVTYSETGERLQPEELLGRIPELADFAAADIRTFERLKSSSVTPSHWVRLARLIDEIVSAEPPPGVVVTHGTSTIEETAYFLSLVLSTPSPVVLVGAMRPASAASSDAWMNLLNAFRVACAPGSAGKGAMVLMNDTIHSPRDATKARTYRLDAFESRGHGPVGSVEADGAVLFYRTPSRLHGPHSDFDTGVLTEDLPEVAITVSYAGARGRLIEAAIESGAKGIVHAGLGAGKATPDEQRALDWAVSRGAVVVQSTRVGGGRVAPSRSLADRGVVASDDLAPWKARILLMLALTKTTDSADIQAIFDSH